MAAAEDIAKVRAWIAERIPAAGRDVDTNFTDAVIGALIDEVGLYRAAEELWSTKASLLLEGRLVDEKNTGTEKIKFMPLKDRYDLYMKRSAYYGGLASTSEASGGTQLAELDPPDVLGIEDADGKDKDLSRLLGYDVPT